MKLFSRGHLVVSCIILGMPVVAFLGFASFAPNYRDLVFTEGSPIQYLVFPAVLWLLLGFLLFTLGIMMINFLVTDDPVGVRRGRVLTITLIVLEVIFVTLPTSFVLLVGPYIFMVVMFWSH